MSLLALTACGAKKTAAPELGDLTYTAYSSCYSSANERQNPRGSGVVDSGYFGKLINRADLESILSVDVPQTANEASRQLLSLYVVNQAGASCSTFSFLNSPPATIYNYWSEATQGTGPNNLLGLYKEDCGGGCQPDRVINPVVLLNACTDRWTMVHEMLHHNFNVQRKRFKPFDSDEVLIASLIHELNTLEEVIGDYNNDSSEYLGMQLVHALDRVRDLMIRFTYQTSFEEVSIESLLLREYALSHLSYVPNTAARNAISYIRYSRAAGIDRLAPIKASAKELASAAKQNGWLRLAKNASTLVAKVNSFEDDSNCYEDEALSTYRQASIAGGFASEVGNLAWARQNQEGLMNAHANHMHSRAFVNFEEELRQTLASIR